MKKYTYVPGSFIAAWLIWELIVRLGGFNEALFQRRIRCCSALVNSLETVFSLRILQIV